MSMFTVDDKCIQCGLCAELCVSGIITIDGGRPFVAPENEHKCIQCGQCVAFCPPGACFLAYQAAEDRIAVQPALMPAAEAAETLLRSRRSVHSYKPEAVEKALLHRILESCRYAPTAANGQLVRWVVTENMEKTKQLGGMTVDFFRNVLAAEPEAADARFLASLIKRWDSGYDFVFRGAPQLAVALYEQKHDFREDAAIALTYFELAAHAHKIGCCWAGFFTRAARQSPEIQKFLGLRENEIIVGGQMFGYPQGLGLSHVLPPRKKIDLSWI